VRTFDKKKSSSNNSNFSKSGLRELQPGEVLFHDGERGDSLFIIQKGQLRLYKPKGKGFVEVGVLRAGEVIGELAYFSAMKNPHRSCSAQAMTKALVIEVSFQAFEKTLEGLNPWFNTIVNTMADRLRNANLRIKELETNSMVLDYSAKDGRQSSYKFFRDLDIIKCLSLLYLTAKSHGEPKLDVLSLNIKSLHYYALNIFSIRDVVLQEFINMMESIGYIKLKSSGGNIMDIIDIHDIDLIRSLLVFYNSQRTLGSDQRMYIPEKTMIFLDKILQKLDSEKITISSAQVSLTPILEQLNAQGHNADYSDLEDAKAHGFVSDVKVNSKNVTTCIVNYKELKNKFACIRLQTTIDIFNQKKIYNETRHRNAV